MLFFAKGGAAVGAVSAATRLNPADKGLLDVTMRDTETRWGWTVGTGAEFALTQNWSAKGEWMYYDLGSEHFIVNSPANLGLIAAGTTGQTVRVGVNYHFGH